MDNHGFVLKVDEYTDMAGTQYFTVNVSKGGITVINKLLVKSKLPTRPVEKSA